MLIYIQWAGALQEDAAPVFASVAVLSRLVSMRMSLNRNLFIYLLRNKTILNKTPKSPWIELGPIARATTQGNCYNCKRAALVYKRLADREACCTLTSCSTLVFESVNL